MSSTTEDMPGNVQDAARAVGSAPVEQVCEDDVEVNAEGEQETQLAITVCAPCGPDRTGDTLDASITSLTCDLCLVSYPQAAMINVGAKDYPRWRDCPCHTSSRWYDKVLTSQYVVPGDLKKHQKSKKYVTNAIN